jgi:pimeloyl-ACP methyl ester carboxylesterase
MLIRRRGLLAGAAALPAAPALRGATAQELRERPAGQEVAPILFVHGNGDSAALWMPTIWRFESNFYARSRLFALDMRLPTARRVDAVREAGRSSTEEATAQLAQEVARVRRATGVERLVLIGHSRGGNIIRNFLRQNPSQRMRAAILCAAPSHGVIVSTRLMVGSEFNGASPFLRALNAMPGEVPPGVPTFTLSSDGQDKWAQPDGRFIGMPGETTGIDALGPALRGATNVVLPGADHMEVAYSAEAFVELHRMATGELPSATRIRPEVRPILNGRVSAYENGAPTNIGIAGARVRLYPVEAETGRRAGPLLHERVTPADGSWGPLEVDPEMHCEFEITVRGYPITHLYRGPFPRGSDHVHLRPYLPAPDDPKEGSLVVVSRPRGYFDPARDRISIGGQTLSGPPDVPHESTLRATGPAAQIPMQVTYNAERLAGLTWPIAERRVTVIELAE